MFAGDVRTCFDKLSMGGVANLLHKSTPLTLSLSKGVGAALAALSLGTASPMVGAGSEWTSPGGDAGKTHHSALTLINAGNVGKFGLAWQAELGTARGMEATPVMVGGVLYTSGVAGRAYAFDAATGKQLWAVRA